MHTTIDLGDAEAVLESVPQAEYEEQLIPILQGVQERYGYLPPAVLDWLSRATGIPGSRIFGIVSFYTQFHLTPQGKYKVACCNGTACHVKGSERIAEAITDYLGVNEGEVSPDGRFSFERVACLGTCFLAPVLMVGDDYYGEVGPDRIAAILDSYK
jgi:NADH-quinone oxidoreductase subunit E